MADEIQAGVTADAGLPAEPSQPVAETPAPDPVTPETPAVPAGEDWTLPPDEDEADEPAATPAVNTPAPTDYLASLNNPYITSPEQLQSAVADATFLLEVVNGKQNAAGLLQSVQQSNPAAALRIANELAPIIEQMTGRKFEGGNADPVQQRLDELARQQGDFLQRQQEAQYERRATEASNATINFLATKLKDSFLEGEHANIAARVVAKTGLEPKQLVDMVERKDFSAIEKALKVVKKEEREAFNARAKRAVEIRKRIQNISPRTVGNKTVDAKGATRFTPESLRDPKVRQEYYDAIAKGEVSVN